MALADLQTALDNLDARIAEVTSRPRPNYSVEGQSYAYADYLRMLLDSRKTLEQNIQRAMGPYVVMTRGST